MVATAKDTPSIHIEPPTEIVLERRCSMSSGVGEKVPCGGKPIRTISGFLELISRFEFEFRRCENDFSNESNFWCVQSSITHTIWL